MRLGLGLDQLGGGVPSFTAEAQTLFSRMSSAPDATRKGHIDTLIRSLKSAGVWSKLDLLYIMAAHDAQSARLNWVQDAYNCSEVNSPAFTVNRGYTGNGSSSYLDTGFNPATAVGKKIGQDTLHMSVWVGTEATGVNVWDAGQDVVGINSRNGSNVRVRGGAAASTNVAAGIYTSLRFTCVARDVAGSFETIRDLETPIVTSSTSASPVSRNIWIGAINVATPSYGNRRVHAMSLGEYLSDTERDALQTALAAYMDAVEIVGYERMVRDAHTAWYSDQRGIIAGGALFFTTVSGTNSGGNIDIHRRLNGVTTTFLQSPALEVDDHNNGCVVKLTSDRLVHFYSEHVDQVTRYRVSTNPAPDIVSFQPERTTGEVASDIYSYQHAYLLGDGNVYLFRRKIGAGASRYQELIYTTEAGLEAGTEVWTKVEIFMTTDQRPYAKYMKNGPGRIDIFTTNAHPAEAANASIYHGYMELDAGTPKFYKSDGTEIVAAKPFDVATEFTLIQANTADNVNESWTWDIRIGADGHPRCLSTRYPTSATTSTVTDIEYWHHRWDGSGWVNHRISEGNTSLYAAQAAYAPGLCFDGNDTDFIYMCETSATGAAELSKYSIDESDGAMTLVEQITHDSSGINMRPFSPIGYTDEAVVWIRGIYGQYTDYEADAFIWRP